MLIRQMPPEHSRAGNCYRRQISSFLSAFFGPLAKMEETTSLTGYDGYNWSPKINISELTIFRRKAFRGNLNIINYEPKKIRNHAKCTYVSRHFFYRHYYAGPD